MRSTRAWAWRHVPTLVWLGVAVVLTLGHPFLEGARWLMIHTVLLGAVGHAVLVWSTHFSEALLRTPPHLDPRRRQRLRLGGFHVGVALVLVGVWLDTPLATIAGATLIGSAALWHLWALAARLRAALPGRFTGSVHYYVVAAAFLPVGVTFGVLLSLAPDDAARARLLGAHVAINVLAWMGLTIVGTLVTFWPTLLRAPMHPRAQRRATQVLPALATAILVIVAGALLGRPVVAATGIVIYLVGLLWWGTTLAAPWRARAPREFAPWSVAAALAWFVVALLWSLALLSAQAGREALALGHDPLRSVLVAGVGAQIVVGALSYLLPAIGGGGPAVVRAAQQPLERFATARVVLFNAGLALCLLPMPSTARVVISLIAFIAWLTFLPLAWASRRAATRVRALPVAERKPASGPAVGESACRGWSPAQFAASLGVLALALAATLAGGGNATTAATAAAGSGLAVAETGRTTQVRVEMTPAMRFVPDVIDVPAGDHLVIELVNLDETTSHDLVLSSGARSDRVRPGGESAFDVGVIGESVDGWCSLIGHRQAGMTLTVRALTADGSAAAPGVGADRSSDATSGHHGQAMPQATPPVADLAQEPDEAFTAVDASLPALESSPGGPPTTHRHTLTIEEAELLVAPGVTQTRWTFGDGVPGPTLHGRVGDVFVITLVNNGTMGHSIDFHAGDVAPDTPMRTIPPGESLEYTFTARRAGIWMYHCATAPMSTHIAAGMHGAVVIEPDDLPAVDRSYVLVQSELYLGADGQVDADKILAEAPDGVVFNGVANQYVHRPLVARVGETVRFWVLSAGPNRGSAFHVVGGQFDTVYHEGAYLLRDGRNALSSTVANGSQVLGLSAAQGGFVEMTPVEAGSYPFVSHAMIDAERGAKGILRVEE